MCGIFCELCLGHCILGKDEKLKERISNRGPDANNLVNLDLNNTNISFFGSVLWMQGKEMVRQPLVNDSGVLLYNGDIFDSELSYGAGDTVFIMEKLSQCIEGTTISEDAIISCLKQLKGPFCMIYYDKTNNNLYFTRDKLGRSSLLLHRNKHKKSYGTTISEDAIISCLKQLKGPFCMIYYDKTNNNLYFTRDKLGRSSLLLHRNKHKKSYVISSVLGRECRCVELPATHIYKWDLDTNKVAQYEWLSCNIAEDDFDSWFKKLECLQSAPDEEHKITCHFNGALENEQHKIIDFVEDVSKKIKDKHVLCETLLANPVLLSKVNDITELLEKSSKIRIERQPGKCKKCIYESAECLHCTVAVLFSGGLDCTILAFLADKYVNRNQPIDLINVAFRKENSTNYDVPDRITGRQSLEELKRICPNRKWNFLEINIPADELKECQEKYIADLVYPRKTILDESLGSALWFASRGTCDGISSSARVLLVGSGADELFGGYTRHRNAFKRHGWSGLYKELCLDWSRISFRNLARDNRVICDHGRQPRMPYLDEDFADYVSNLKPWFRCFPAESLGPGIGDKLMLRLLAFNMGLKDVAFLPKRALQFGSRIANKKEKGSEISTNFCK